MPTRLDWFPFRLSERLAATRLVAAKIDEYSALLGLTADQVERLKAIPVEFAFAMRLVENSQAVNRAVRIWRDSILSNRRPNNLAHERPMFDNSPAPAGTRLGIIAEFRKLVAIIKASPGFSVGIGINLGIMRPNHVSEAMDEIAPSLSVAAEQNYGLRISGSLKGMDMICIEIQRKDWQKWENLAFLTTLPETVTVEPSVDGDPESIMVRGILLKKNKKVGLYSNMASAVIYRG